MQKLTYRPIKDYRVDMVNSYTDECEFRPSVETLQEKYARVIDQIDEECSTKKVKVVKKRGGRKVTRVLTSTQQVRQRLNRVLPKIKRFAKTQNGFTVAEFQEFMRIGNTSAQKYINILLASTLIRHDGKRWAARYVWNDDSKTRHL